MENNKEIIKLDVNLAPEDLYAFQKHLLIKSSRRGILMAAVAGLVLFLIMIITSEAAVVQKMTKLAPLLAIPVIFVFYLFAMLKRTARKSFKNNEEVTQTQKFTITREHIEVDFDNGHTDIKWTDLYTATEIKECFLLFISKQQAYVISKRYFEGDQKKADLMREFMLQAPVQKK